LSGGDEIILVDDDIFEVGDFGVPVFADFGGLTTHGSKVLKGGGPFVEISLEGFDFSLVVSDFSLQNWSSNGIAGNDGRAQEDTTSAATINFGSHVTLPIIELLAFSFGSESQSLGDGGHFALDGFELTGEVVELSLGVGGIFVTSLKGFDKDFDANSVKSLFSALEFVLVLFEGNIGDFLHVLSSTFEVFSKRLDGSNADIDIPYGLI